MGTPLGGERKSRRFRSPLHEMDGAEVEDEPEADNSTPMRAMHLPEEPTTPTQAVEQGGPVTLAAIENLLKREIAPMRRSALGLERQMAELNVSVDDRLAAMSGRLLVNEET